MKKKPMNTFVSNFVDIMKTKNAEDMNLQKDLSSIEQQLYLAEKYITEKRKKCAQHALLIVRELWEEKKDKAIMERYNNAIELFSAL